MQTNIQYQQNPERAERVFTIRVLPIYFVLFLIDIVIAQRMQSYPLCINMHLPN